MTRLSAATHERVVALHMRGADPRAALRQRPHLALGIFKHVLAIAAGMWLVGLLLVWLTTP